MLARVFKSNRLVVRGMVLGALFGTTLALSAVAQPGRGGGISPELRAKVDAAKAGAVAAELKLDAEKSAKLAEVYSAYQKDNAANPPKFDRENRDAMRAEFEKRQAKLESDLKTVLDEAQAKDAAAVLGGFSRGWDRMVAVILEFNLGAEKESQALAHTVAYVKAGLKARGNAASGQDPEAARAAMATAKKSLDDSLAPLLSDEQKAKWSESTSWGGRGGDRGERGERGGERGERGKRGEN